MKNGNEFRIGVNLLYNMGLADFQRVWGDHDGEHLWNVYRDRFKRNDAEFIGYLDGDNLEKYYCEIQRNLNGECAKTADIGTTLDMADFVLIHQTIEALLDHVEETHPDASIVKTAKEVMTYISEKVRK